MPCGPDEEVAAGFNGRYGEYQPEWDLDRLAQRGFRSAAAGRSTVMIDAAPAATQTVQWVLWGICIGEQAPQGVAEIGDHAAGAARSRRMSSRGRCPAMQE